MRECPESYCYFMLFMHDKSASKPMNHEKLRCPVESINSGGRLQFGALKCTLAT